MISCFWVTKIIYKNIPSRTFILLRWISSLWLNTALHMSSSQLSTDHVNQFSFEDDLGIIKSKPKYPKYASLDVRIRSFRKPWPERNKPEPIELSKAGFAYTGVGDSVKCYHCGGGLSNWKEDTSPWEQHALVYPSCGHLWRCKGAQYITTVSATRSKDTVQEYEGNGHFNELTWASLDCLATAMKVNNVAISAVKDFVTDDIKIRHGICWLLSNHKTCFSAMELMAAVDEADPEDDDDVLINENAELRRPVTCKICIDAIASIVTLPCGHMVSCPQCIAPLSRCAVCRADIEGTIKASLCTSDNETVNLSS